MSELLGITMHTVGSPSSIISKYDMFTDGLDFGEVVFICPHDLNHS